MARWGRAGLGATDIRKSAGTAARAVRPLRLENGELLLGPASDRIIAKDANAVLVKIPSRVTRVDRRQARL